MASPNEEVVTQMGLMLTQLRGMRQSLDGIAQATSRYAGFAFAQAFSPGGRFGAPPMRAGALLVHISNIRDLVASSGVAGFFEGLLGGVGRFFGGLFGGLIGGTIAGVALPVLIGQVDSIVRNIRQILNQLGIGTDRRRREAQPAEAAREQAPASVAGRPLSEQIGEFREILELATGLFEAAVSGTGQPAPQRVQASLTPAGERWLAMLQAAGALIDGLTRLVNGLIRLVPILIGSLALLIEKLDAIKLAFVEMLQFILRNALLLRGVVLVTVFDLLGSAARLAAGLIQVIGGMLQNILTAVFSLAGTVLQGALAAFQFLAGGLQRTINGMLRWLVDTLFVALAWLGDLRIFRLITHVIRVLPAVLPPLYELLRKGGSPPLSAAERTALTDAAALTIPNAAFTSSTLPSSSLPAMPNLADLVAPPAAQAELLRQLDLTRDGLVTGVGDAMRAARDGFTGLSDRFGQLVQDELTHNRGEYAGHLATVRQRSTEFASAFGEAERAARERPQTGLETIARAYEEWLSGEGFRTLLGSLTDQFRATPPSATGSIPGEVVGTTVDRPRASIEIEEVVIDLTPGAEAGPELTDEQTEDLIERLLRYWREQQQRGGAAEPLTA